MTEEAGAVFELVAPAGTEATAQFAAVNTTAIGVPAVAAETLSAKAFAIAIAVEAATAIASDDQVTPHFPTRDTPP